ncbi:MAG: glycosyltransferase family 39 protein [Myxococcota bacterium]|nr:glycosyltransferase family 39 protein [Myxococcota bacterium]
MANDTSSEESSAGFGEAVLGRATVVKVEKRLSRFTPDVRFLGAVLLLGVAILIPYLGAVGLWDPWETHYGEVARSMIQRNDYVHPYWENDWFFSKPPLTMWMQALGMQVVGTNRAPTDAALALYTEWGMRLPFVLLSLAALALLGLAVKRIASTRAALATVFALCTMPMYFLISRQAVTDTPMVACITAALACALIALFDPATRHRTAWWFGFYIFTSGVLLAKELLAAIPPTVLLLYAAFCVFPWTSTGLEEHGRWLSDPSFRREVQEGRRPMPVLWEYMFRMKLLTGLGVFLAVAGPWYLMMITFPELDDENRTFIQRLLHDNFSRLGAGVHTTTPGGEFTYFIVQGGYAIFPWVALVPGVLALLFRMRLRSPSRVDQLANFSFFWMLLCFSLFAFSATKFHHYVFPVLPPLAVLIGLYVDKLWEEGVGDHAFSLLIGAVLFALVGKDLASNPKNFTDLFVYNYERTYPTELVTRPLSFFDLRTLWTGDLLTLLLLAFGAYLASDAWRGKERNVGGRATALGLLLGGGALLLAMATRGRQSPTLFLGLGLALVAIYLGYEATRLPADRRGSLLGSAGAVGILALGLVIAGGRMAPNADPLLTQLMQPVNVKLLLGIAFAVGGGLAMLAALMRARTLMFGSFWALALGFALWFNWSHWVDLSHHWTQRDLFWRYYEQKRPNEPIAAFLMNWRGETFYSRNRVKQIPAASAAAKARAYADQPGREWALVEHFRLANLKTAVGADHTVTPIDRDVNNKFLLVTID